MEKRITVRIDQVTHEKFKIIAIKQNTAMSALLKKYIETEVKEKSLNEKN